MIRVVIDCAGSREFQRSSQSRCPASMSRDVTGGGTLQDDVSDRHLPLKGEPASRSNQVRARSVAGSPPG